MIDEDLRKAAEDLLFAPLAAEPGARAASRRVETPLYRDYLERRAAYEAARAAYEAARREAQTTASGRGTWPLLGPALQLPVQQAYDRWRAANAEQIERAVALLGRSDDEHGPPPRGSRR